MAHYHQEEWRDYCRGRLDRARRARMERHLAQCDRCLQEYLALIGEPEAAAAALLLPPDFETGLQNFIRQKQSAVHRTWRRRLLLNYAAAAVITLALTAGGFFDTLARQLPAFLDETRTFSQAITATASGGWAEDILQLTTQQINKLLLYKEE